MPLHWPGYNYLGPMTKKFDKKPKNKIDKAAKKHDLAYEGDGDTREVDETFLREIESAQAEDPLAYAAGFIGIRAKQFADETALGGAITHYLRSQVCLK